MLALHLAIAGLWPLLWHFGIGVGLIILLLAGAWFSPVGKKDFVYAAIVVAVALMFEAEGVKLEKNRQVAEQAVITNDIAKVVQETDTAPYRAKRDHHDKKNN
jgi:hypothetical protein